MIWLKVKVFGSWVAMHPLIRHHKKTKDNSLVAAYWQPKEQRQSDSSSFGDNSPFFFLSIFRQRCDEAVVLLALFFVTGKSLQDLVVKG